MLGRNLLYDPVSDAQITPCGVGLSLSEMPFNSLVLQTHTLPSNDVIIILEHLDQMYS